MYIIIAGAGRVGSEITKIMVNNKHDVVVIDIDPQICNDIYSETGAMTINGNATTIRTLEKAGAEKADAILCLMHSEADNIACALLARKFDIPHVITRMIDPEYEEAYKMAGVTLVIRAIDLLTKQIIIELENPKVKEVAVIGGGKAQIYNIVVPPEATVADKPIREIVSMKDFPNEVAFMGIYRADEDEFIITRGSHVLHPGDNVFIISKSQHIKQASDILTARV